MYLKCYQNISNIFILIMMVIKLQ